MPRKNGAKCLAMTVKPANSKRPNGEISQCTRFALPESRFCTNHQNLNDLSDEQFRDNTQICRACKKHQYFADMGYRTCDSCRDRGDTTRDRQRGEKVQYVPCVICGFTGGSERKFANYCNKHATDGRKADIESRNMKCCKWINRDCPNPELPIDYPYEKCEVCRNKDRVQSKERLVSQVTTEVNQIKDTISPSQTDVILISTSSTSPSTPSISVKPKIQIKLKIRSTVEPQLDPIMKVEIPQEDLSLKRSEPLGGSVSQVDTPPQKVSSKTIHEEFDRVYIVDGIPQKICSVREHWCLHPLDNFLSDDGLTYYNQWKQSHTEPLMSNELNEVVDYMRQHYMIKRQCRQVRELSRIQDRKRDRSGRDYKEYESRPETKARRANWKNDNKVKCSFYWKKYRANKVLTDQVGYLQHNAEIQKAYRKSHPEKYSKMNCDAKKNVERKEYTYRNSADTRGIPFNLTSDECSRLFKDKCFYCGYQSNDGTLNGIDRLNNDREYTDGNCVTACSMCNYMKHCIDPMVFIDMCEHILTHLGVVNGVLHPQIFADFWTGKSLEHVYGRYVSRAEKKKSTFPQFNEFIELINKPCYLCGKLSKVGEHINGIDRYDNEIGYTLQNCRTSCGTCNFLKKDLNYDLFVNKIREIYENNYISEYIAENNAKAEYLRNYREKKNITKSHYVHQTPEEKRERERLRKQEQRAKKKQQSQALIDSLSKK
jgi:hypothetical protein